MWDYAKKPSRPKFKTIVLCKRSIKPNPSRTGTEKYIFFQKDRCEIILVILNLQKTSSSSKLIHIDHFVEQSNPDRSSYLD